MAKDENANKKLRDHFGILLDASGSMSPHVTRVMEGINGYLSEVRKMKGTLSIVQFDSTRYEALRQGKPKDIAPLEPGEYKTGGATPLFAALTRMITDMGSHNSDRVTIIVDTDGLENNSGSEFSMSQISDLVKSRQKDGWTFVFMGCDMDAWAGGLAMGLPVATMNTRSFESGQRVSHYADLGKQSLVYASHRVRSTSKFWKDQSEKSTSAIYATKGH